VHRLGRGALRENHSPGAGTQGSKRTCAGKRLAPQDGSFGSIHPGATPDTHEQRLLT